MCACARTSRCGVYRIHIFIVFVQRGIAGKVFNVPGTALRFRSGASENALPKLHKTLRTRVGDDMECPWYTCAETDQLHLPIVRVDCQELFLASSNVHKSGFSLARSRKLSNQWDKVLRAGLLEGSNSASQPTVLRELSVVFAVVLYCLSSRRGRARCGANSPSNCRGIESGCSQNCAMT